jgi:DNA-binding transcriptional MerR regulator
MPLIFESRDVIRLVGISPVYLNKFVERGLYGITPSERTGLGKGNRRWFNSEDVFGIGLVWWLFEAGLRSEVIKRILREVVSQKKANANQAAKTLQKNGSDFVAIRRLPRLGGDKHPRHTLQTIALVEKSDVLDFIGQGDAGAVHVIPVGKLFRKLERLIQES